MALYGILDGEDRELIAVFAAPVAVRSNVPVTPSDSLSLLRRTRSVAAQRWEISAGIVPMSDGGHKLMKSLVTKGTHSPTEVLVPQSVGVILRRTGSLSKVLLTDGGLAGESQVSAPAYSGFMPRGTFLRFGNHSKVYVTLSDFDGSGAVSVFPPLRADLAETYMYHGDDVVMECFYDRDTVQGMRYTDGILMDPGELVLVESIPRDTDELLPAVFTSTPYTVAVDTNGVRTDLPSMAVYQWFPNQEDYTVVSASLVSGASTVMIVYKDLSLYDTEEYQPHTAVLLSGASYTTIAYVDLYEYDTEEYQIGHAVLLSGASYTTINYVDLSVYDVEEYGPTGATVISGESTIV
jgi:hypothetical protein